MSGISAGKALGYATLPGLWPRVKSLFFSGFGTLAYFMALTYTMVRLLPPSHPYLDPRNIGQYGIRHVIAAALHELKFSWKNLDQIIIFFALMVVGLYDVITIGGERKRFPSCTAQLVLFLISHPTILNS